MKQEHILVCLSASPSNPHIVQTAAKMAEAFDAVFTALYIEPISYKLTAENEERLHRNIQLASSLNARIETIQGDDTAYQIAEFAALSGVTKIVIGQNTAPRHLFSKKTLTDHLIENVKNIDIYIVPDSTAALYRRRYSIPFSDNPISLSDGLVWFLSLFLTTLAGLWFRRAGMPDSTIIPLYILAVLIISVTTSRSVFGMTASMASVFIFNFFYTEPIYTLRAYDPSYWVTFIVMLISAVLASSLAVRIKAYAGETAQRAYRTQTLLDTNQLLQKTTGNDEISSTIADQLRKLLNTDVIFYIAENGRLLTPKVFSSQGEAPASWSSPTEKEAVNWCFEHNKAAGNGTENHPEAQLLYLSIYFQNSTFGVVGIDTSRKNIDPFEYSLVISILGECALAMENAVNMHAKEEAAVFAKNQQLRADLLRTLSHDLRTPLTSIFGNASTLRQNEKLLDEHMRHRMYEDIEEDAQWLIETVENLLATTRLENGKMTMHMEIQAVDEVIYEALRHVSRDAEKHHVHMEENDEILMARMDARLISQVIINLVNNAVKYTPEGSNITIKSWRKDHMVCVSVIDDGPGISDENKKDVFEMFFSIHRKVADSRRSLGLGLALCRSIAEAHNGTIELEDNVPHGCIFTFMIPEEEVILNEEQ